MPRSINQIALKDEIILVLTNSFFKPKNSKLPIKSPILISMPAVLIQCARELMDNKLIELQEIIMLRNTNATCSVIVVKLFSQGETLRFF